MGCDASNDLPGVSKRDVEEFLMLLGYRRVVGRPFAPIPGASYFSYFDPDDYRHITGVGATVVPSKDGVVVYTRTTIWRSKIDSEFHNFTIRQLRKRFGGTFHTDAGPNRYFKNEGEPVREKAEGGAYAAFSRFENNSALAGIYLQNAPTVSSFDFRQFPPEMAVVNPVVIAHNMVVPFFVAIMEEYFRATFVALLRYSQAREKILGGIRVAAADLIPDESDLSLYDMAARRMSFQQLDKVHEHFRSLDKGLDIAGWLKKPHGRRKEAPLSCLQRLVHHRHALVHRAELEPYYDHAQAERDRRTLELAIKRVYHGLAKHYRWTLSDAA